MPTKKLNGTTATIDEVIELHELGDLAEDWARVGAAFPTLGFDRYKELCAKYAVNPATLLYIFQAKVTEFAEFGNGAAARGSIDEAPFEAVDQGELPIVK